MDTGATFTKVPRPILEALDIPDTRTYTSLLADGRRVPKELGDDSTIHRTFQRWVEMGVLERVWSMLLEECEELGAVEWQWQAADCAMGKARFGGIQ